MPEDELFLRGLRDLDIGDDMAVRGFCDKNGLILQSVAQRGLATLVAQEAVTKGKIPKGSAVALEMPAAGVENDRFHLRVARAIVGHWLALQEGTSLHRAWFLEGFDTGKKAVKANPFFIMALNAGLAPFSVRINEGFYGADLFSALCLQLYNAIIESEDEPVRRCENETCGKPFIHQQGRAERGRRRSGAIYCSDLCARAQAQRVYRRKQRKSRKAPRKGKR